MARIDHQTMRAIRLGSRRLNEMKQEIDDVVKITLGLISSNDTFHIRAGEKVCELHSEKLYWQTMKTMAGNIVIIASKGGLVIYSSASGASQVSRQNVIPLLEDLPEVLDQMVGAFPVLAMEFSYLMIMSNL